MSLVLGPTALAALEHCAAHGLLSPERILGALAHPSGSSGPQVDVYIGARDPDSLHPRDPVRLRAVRLLAEAARVRAAIARLRSGAAAGGPTPALLHTPTLPAAAALPRVRAVEPSAPFALATGGGNDHLHAFVARGREAGARLTPHLYKDGYYVVSATKFERDQIGVHEGEDLEAYLRQGLRLRMSGPDKAPRLIVPRSILDRRA